MSFGQALSVLLLSASCALCACAVRDDAPAPADTVIEHSQGTPLHSPPSIAEQRIDGPAQQPAAASQPAPQRAPQRQQAPPQAEPGYIILQPGETLSYISALYAVSEKDLIAWNGLSSAHEIRAGQRLAIRPPGMRNEPSAQAGRTAAPAPQTVAPAKANGSIGAPVDQGRMAQHQPQKPARGATPDAPDADGMITVQPGQSLSAIAAKYKVGITDLRRWNALKNDQIQIGQKLRVKAPVRIHTVKAGENLGGIAAKYKVSATALMRANKLANPDLLPVGKELIIP